MTAIGKRLYTLNKGGHTTAPSQTIAELLRNASARVAGHRFAHQFLMMECEYVVDAWQLATWEDYRDVPRLGR